MCDLRTVPCYREDHSEGGFHFERGKKEGSALYLGSGKMTFRYCDDTSKASLGDYLRDNYKRLVPEHLKGRDVFIVTGTLTTQNWEARAYQRQDADRIRVDGRSGRINGARGTTKFSDQTVPEGQSVFLRGWGVREMSSFTFLSKRMKITEKNCRNWEWRRKNIRFWSIRSFVEFWKDLFGTTDPTYSTVVRVILPNHYFINSPIA